MEISKMSQVKIPNIVEQYIQDIKIKNCDVTIARGTSAGDNYFGNIETVVVKGRNESEESVTSQLIVKTIPQNEYFIDSFAVGKMYEREIFIYTRVLPEFHKMQMAKGLTPIKIAPECYKTSLLYMKEALLLENVKEIGFIQKDRCCPLDLQHTNLVMRQFGKLHALSFALRDQKPEIFQELVEILENSLFKNGNCDVIRRVFYSKLTRILGFFDPVKDKEIYMKFLEFRNNSFDAVLEILDPAASGKHGVLVHGDNWTNNMLFKYEDRTKPTCPTKLCLLDWQLSHCGSPALDLSYFIFVATDKDLRDKHFGHFMRSYHESFTSQAQAFGIDPNILFPFEALEDNMRTFAKYGVLMALSCMDLLVSEKEEVLDIDDILDRVNNGNLIPSNLQNEDKMIERARDIIIDSFRMGYL